MKVFLFLVSLISGGAFGLGTMGRFSRPISASLITASVCVIGAAVPMAIRHNLVRPMAVAVCAGITCALVFHLFSRKRAGES